MSDYHAKVAESYAAAQSGGDGETPIAFEQQLLTIRKAVEDLAKNARYQQHQQQHQQHHQPPVHNVNTPYSSTYFQQLAFKPSAGATTATVAAKAAVAVHRPQPVENRAVTSTGMMDPFVRPQALGTPQVKFDPFAPVTSFSVDSTSGSQAQAQAQGPTHGPTHGQGISLATVGQNPQTFHTKASSTNAALTFPSGPNAAPNSAPNHTESLNWSKVWGKPSGVTSVWG